MNKNTRYICLIGILGISMIVMAMENPNVGNPTRRSNTSTPSNSSYRQSSNPVSSGHPQRFITQPGSNPYGQTGNDIMTGNIGGGKHFRGIVPYGSSYYNSAYSGSLNSRSVNNFMRRSANPIVNDRNPGQTQTYYDPRRTVTSMSRPDGTSGLQAPQVSGQGRNNPYKLIAQTQDLKVQPVRRPVTANDIDLEKILERQYLQRQKAMEKAELDKESDIVEESFFETFLQQDTSSEQDTTKTDEQEQTEQQQDIPELTFELKSLETTEEQIDPQNEQAESTEEAPKDWMNPESDLIPKVDLEKIDRAEGRKILGEHKTFASLADEKFDNYMRLAETHLRKGEFYKAADIFDLALVWKPEDGRGYLGQSMALFFAGEYMSSAYFLDRSFRLNPDLASKKVDLTELSGNRDAFENSNLELMTVQQKSNSPEMTFLLAYVAFQDGKTDRAIRLINIAAEAMPDARAVTLLKNVIDPTPESK